MPTTPQLAPVGPTEETLEREVGGFLEFVTRYKPNIVSDPHFRERFSTSVYRVMHLWVGIQSWRAVFGGVEVELRNKQYCAILDLLMADDLDINSSRYIVVSAMKDRCKALKSNRPIPWVQNTAALYDDHPVSAPAVDRARLALGDLLESLPASKPDMKASASKGDPLPDDPPSTRKKKRRKWLADAMLMVNDHPERSDAEIARRVHVNKSTLTRCREYRMAATLARAKPDRPRGYAKVDPDSKTRAVEASDEAGSVYRGGEPADEIEELDARIDADIAAKRNTTRNAKPHKSR